MPAEGRSCAGCLNWHRRDGDRGECRALPPRFTGPMHWPPVLASDWCGAWRPLPVVQGKSQEATLATVGSVPASPAEADWPAFYASLSVRLRKTLNSLKVASFAGLCNLDADTLLMERNFGRACFADLSGKMRALGLALRSPPIDTEWMVRPQRESVQSKPPPRPAPVEVFYRNHRGEEAWRRVSVLSLRFGVAPPWHAEPQALLEVWDHDKQAARTFALAGCIDWRAVEGGGT